VVGYDDTATYIEGNQSVVTQTNWSGQYENEFGQLMGWEESGTDPFGAFTREKKQIG